MLFAAASVLAFASLSPHSAHAYRQTKTCMHPEERDLRAPTLVPDCTSQEKGWPVSWPKRTISYRIYRDAGVEGIAQADVHEAIRQGIEEWNSPACSDFVFSYAGTTAQDRHNPKDRVNIITILDEAWPDTSDAIALTTTTMTQRGVLVDADVELNAAFNRFTLDGEATGVDLRNALAHEAGHMLGLDHSAVEESTMNYEAPDGEILKRDLHPDDIAGLCLMYSADVPERIYADEADGERGCCAVLPARQRPLPHMLLVLALGAVWMRRAQRAASAPRRSRRGQ